MYKYTNFRKLNIDTSDPYNTLKLQLETMRLGSTKTVYQLASPSNRLTTAQGGYNYSLFDKMVRSPTYSALLNFDKYRTLKKEHLDSQFIADILIVKNGLNHIYRFQMSLQPPNIIDTHSSLSPFQMIPGHPPVWRTDSVDFIK